MIIKRKFHIKKFSGKNKIMSAEEIERYNDFAKQKCDYYLNFEFEISVDYCDVREYIFLKRAVKTLSPLTTPSRLAGYLKIDITLVMRGITEGLIPYFTDGYIYSIKTIGILPFVRKIYDKNRN